MKDDEKIIWMSLYMIIILPFLLTFAMTLGERLDLAQTGGWVGLGYLVILTVILIFRNVYLAGKNSR